MVILNTLLQWCGLVFIVGTVVLIIKENKKSMPTKEEKDFLISCGAIAPDCKDKKVLRKATLDLRQTQYVLQSLELTKEEILDLSKQSQERKMSKKNVSSDNSKVKK